MITGRDETDFLEYLTWGTEELLERLARVAAMLGHLIELECEAQVGELAAKSEAWRRADPEAGPTLRKQVMDIEAVPASQTLLETKAQIKALGEEKAFLLTLIDVRSRVPVAV